MMNDTDIRNLTSLSEEARHAVTGAFKALAQWREEIFSANDRYLTKALDQMGAAQHALGWPDDAAAAAREHLLKASKAQTHMIDQVMDVWEQQLKSPTGPSGVPMTFAYRMPALAGPTSTDPLADMMLAPFLLWMQAAQMWQRNWATAVLGSAEPKSPPPTREAA